MQKYVLLDIDGVMVPASGWKPVELHPDGFYMFNRLAQKNLGRILMETGASVILTTTHRGRYKNDEWREVFRRRFQFAVNVQTIDDVYPKVIARKSFIPQPGTVTCIDSGSKKREHSRFCDVVGWLAMYGENRYVIIDDDTSLDALPAAVKRRWVKTSPAIGLNDEAAEKALTILNEF
ncbi:hypothetical protein EGT74_15525 [Chitinophaga lutea]|uniref:Polynucleotide kinase n=1 Tax=Chitinophaga lutea TaxID=2488634 RepID=A0A3N4PKX3_9BACT|nr:HAD domain-containing protein [Chitinophaga lutea]RPE08455.1 hypothetical protein EGT74_15525 [Chitinophaga lutea]